MLWSNVHIEQAAMRTNIDIDDKLMAKAMKAAGKSTKKETVQEALELLVRIRESERKLRQLYGKIKWEGDLDAMRRAERSLSTRRFG
jgi:Arc/MetJ family transcription regulator